MELNKENGNICTILISEAKSIYQRPYGLRNERPPYCSKI